jgi:hypothetical protein
VGGPVTATTQDVIRKPVNLSSFSSNGGKLVFYHGLSDPWFSAKYTIDYCQRMRSAKGRG